jgi:hypothetical protein
VQYTILSLLWSTLPSLSLSSSCIKFGRFNFKVSYCHHVYRNLKAIFHTQWLHNSMLHPHTQLHMHGTSGSLDTVFRLKTKEYFHVATKFLYKKKLP